MCYKPLQSRVSLFATFPSFNPIAKPADETTVVYLISVSRVDVEPNELFAVVRFGAKCLSGFHMLKSDGNGLA